jgi:aspartyl protease family protein
VNLGDLGHLAFEQPLLALTIAAILLGVAAGMFMATRPRLGQALRNTAYLGLVAALLLTVAGLARHNDRSDAALWLDRTRPAQIVGRETVIAKRVDGHFWVEAQLDGQPVDFLIDTGATYTGVSRRVAERVGLADVPGDKGMILDTANGPIVARLGLADSLRFGGIEANALPIAIAPDTEVDTNVIGMNLLSQLKAWRVEGDRLVLTPKP